MRTNTKALKAAFIKSYGDTLNITESAKAVGVSRQTIFMWRKKDPKFLDAVIECEEAILDKAESNLYKLVADKDFQAIKFALTSRRHGRWTVNEKMAIDLTSGGQPVYAPININFEVVPPRDVKKLLDEVNSGSDTAKDNASNPGGVQQ